AMHDPREVARREKTNIMIGAVARSAPLPRPLKTKVLAKVAYRRRVDTETAAPSPEPPDCFLLEIYNPNAKPIDVTLSIRPRGAQPARAFQRVVLATPGFFRAEVPFGDIIRQVDLRRPFEVEIVPNEPDDTVLYFGVMDFVRLREKRRAAAA